MENAKRSQSPRVFLEVPGGLRFCPKVARLQEYTVSMLYRTVIIQCIPTRWNRKKCVEKVAQICFGERDDARNLLVFTVFFEGWALSSNPSFSARWRASNTLIYQRIRGFSNEHKKLAQTCTVLCSFYFEVKERANGSVFRRFRCRVLSNKCNCSALSAVVCALPAALRNPDRFRY